MPSSIVSRKSSAEHHARHIGTAILDISTDGKWSLGQVQYNARDYQTVKFNGISGVDDDTFNYTALTAEARKGGGYAITLRSNDDHNQFVEAYADSHGNLTGAVALGETDIYATEVSLGIDLNGNGGLGDAMVLVDAGSVSMYVDGMGAYQFKQSGGSFNSLTFAGQSVTQSLLTGWTCESVVVKDDGYQFYFRDGHQNVAEFGSDAAGVIDPQTLKTLSSAELAAAKLETGDDLNGNGDIVVTADWAMTLKSLAIRAEVVAQTANGARINHAGLVKIVDSAIDSLHGSAHVGADVFNDLKAIAAHSSDLFTSKDIGGIENSYLNFVFEKMINGSVANNFFTGGVAKSDSLGCLSPDSSVVTLQKLESKWLLGKDLPNPFTAGDAANPNSFATTGTYKAFNAPLFTGGAAAFDVNQGSAATCYLLSALASIAQVDPGYFERMFDSNGATTDGLETWGVRFFDAYGNANWVTVNNQLVVKNTHDTNTAYAKVRGVDAQGTPTQELWAPLVEKAYAQANELEIFGRIKQVNAMFAVEGGLAEAVVNVAGGSVTHFADSVYVLNGNPILTTSLVPEGSTALTEYTKALNSGKVIFVASFISTKDSNGAILFAGGHAYMAYDADPLSSTNTTVEIYNPWGFSTQSDATPNPAFIAPFDNDLASLVGTPGISIWIGA